MERSFQSSGKNGFTLAEILLAMMVFAIAITTILGLLARSIETTDSILIKNEAISLSSAVEGFMTDQPFAAAYSAVVAGQKLYAYQYRANPISTREEDGTLEPFVTLEADDQLGQDYVVVPGVRLSTDTTLDEDEAALESRLFEVELSVSGANPAGVTGLPSSPDNPGSSYDSAVLVVLAEFYPVPTVGSTVPPDVVPIFSFNFAVGR